LNRRWLYTSTGKKSFSLKKLSKNEEFGWLLI
jgi:hypothetical protein